MRRSSPLCACAQALVASVLAASAGMGCGGIKPSLKSENQRLEAKVAELRARARRDRRVIHDLENKVLVLKDRLARAGDEEEAVELDPELQPEPEASYGAPDLPVEVLGREGEAPPAQSVQVGEVAGLSDDGVEIVYAGEALSSESVSLSPEQYELGESGEPPPPPPDDTLPSFEGKVPRLSEVRGARTPRIRSRKRSFADPRAEYQRYYRALKRGDHAAAVSGFRNFLSRFSRHDYADNARYWLGEAYYDQKRYRPALAEFQKVLEDYPGENKVPDALLKVAYCQLQLGERAAARASLRRLIARHPRSNPAALAARKLEEIEESP